MTPQLLLPAPASKVEVCDTIHDALVVFNAMKAAGFKPRISSPMGSTQYTVIGNVYEGDDKSPAETLEVTEVPTAYVTEL